jgi:hypothetical protein
MEASIDGVEEDVVRVASVLPEHHAAEAIVPDVERLVRKRFCVFVVHAGWGAGVEGRASRSWSPSSARSRRDGGCARRCKGVRRSMQGESYAIPSTKLA